MVLALAAGAAGADAQQNAAQAGGSAAVAQQTIGHIDVSATAEKIRVAGAVTLGGDSTLLGNGSTVTAGKAAILPIHLARGLRAGFVRHDGASSIPGKQRSRPEQPLVAGAGPWRD